MSMPQDESNCAGSRRRRRAPVLASAMFVGRVGGLAVALGIGVAIAGSSGIAGADTDGSDSSHESTASPGPSASHDSSVGKGAPVGANSLDAADGTTSTLRPKFDLPKVDRPKSDQPKLRQGDMDGESSDQEPAEAVRSDAIPAKSTGRPIVASIARINQVAAETDSTVPGPSGTRANRQVHIASDVPATPATPAVAPSGGPTEPAAASSAAATTSLVQPTAAVTAISPLGTQQQLDAERRATETANTLPVALLKLLLRFGFASAAQQQFAQVGGPDQGNLDQLDAAVNEYAMGAAFQQQILNSNDPMVVLQVAPPHTWYGQMVPGSRILYDNPDTIYRFIGVNAASSYVIRGQFTGPLPADTTFSVLTGLSGTTAAVLGKRDLVVNPDGSFTITASNAPAALGQVNHLQLTNDSTLIATRNTLSDWGTEVPMTLSVERVGGPPNSLFSQLGGFAIPGLGPLVVANPLLTALVSLIPPMADPPPLLRGVFAALIMALGIQREATYIAVATTDPATGQPIPPNVLKDPTRNAEFLATQLQSAGYFQLTDQQALVVTIHPGNANYFVLPVTNDWTISNDYWNQQTSLNKSQALANPDGSYTIVISPTDPGVANWASTGGLNQGTISMRFQDLDPGSTERPSVSSQVVSLDQLSSVLPEGTVYYTQEQRATQLATRKAGFDNRFAPFPQP